MTISLHQRSFLSLFDFDPQEIRYLLDLAHQLKAQRQQGIRGNTLTGKNIALLFEKTSTRTRCAFEVGVVEEGGQTSFIDLSTSQFSKKESVEDSAKVLASYYDAIEFRGYSQKTLEDLAKYAKVPVYNGLTDEDHPTQILADLMTIEELFPDKPLKQIKVVYIGDTRNNVCNALMYGCAKLGMQFVAYGPKELQPDAKVLTKAEQVALAAGARIQVSADPDALLNADVIYTDVWVSMGEDAEIVKRANLLQNFRVTMKLLQQTQNPRVIFMHCLPALHDHETYFVKKAQAQFGVDIREVTDEVFRSANSVVFQQAENRLHAIKSILVATLGSKNI
jgi:ornithine carbamoyltransferase